MALSFISMPDNFKGITLTPTRYPSSLGYRS